MTPNKLAAFALAAKMQEALADLVEENRQKIIDLSAGHALADYDEGLVSAADLLNMLFETLFDLGKAEEPPFVPDHSFANGKWEMI